MIELLKYIGSFAVVTAILGFIAKSIFEKYLESKLENYKQALALEYEKSRLEHQVSFTRIYEARANAIQELYVPLNQIQNKLIDFRYLVMYNQGEKAKDAAIAINSLVEQISACLEKNRLYFSEELCNEVAQVLAKLMFNAQLITAHHTVRLQNQQIETDNARKSPFEGYGTEFDETLVDEVKDLRMELAVYFRKQMGIN